MGIKIADMQVDYVDHLGGDINVVNAARVSFAKEVKEFDLDKDTTMQVDVLDIVKVTQQSVCWCEL